MDTPSLKTCLTHESSHEHLIYIPTSVYFKKEIVTEKSLKQKVVSYAKSLKNDQKQNFFPEKKIEY